MPVANCKITGITRNTDNERISVCHARSFVRWQLHTGNTGNRRLALSMTDQLSRPERASILARNPSFESRSFAKVGKKRICVCTSYYLIIVRFITIRTISLFTSPKFRPVTFIIASRDSPSFGILFRKGSIPEEKSSKDVGALDV